MGTANKNNAKVIGIMASPLITFRKAPFLYQHVIGHNYATLQQFKESRDKNTM